MAQEAEIDRHGAPGEMGKDGVENALFGCGQSGFQGVFDGCHAPGFNGANPVPQLANGHGSHEPQACQLSPVTPSRRSL